MLVAATALALAACGSSGSGGRPAAPAQYSAIKAATVQSPASSAPKGPTIDLAALDACSLITADVANRVAHAEELDNFQTASTVYAFTATKQPGTDPNCKFTVADEDTKGTVVFHFQSATAFVVGPGDQRVTGLGDEAYDDGDDPVVRVGNVKITATDDSFSDSFTVALIRAIIPKLK